MSNVLRGQSLINKAIELTGDAESALALSILNGVSLTDSLLIGSRLKAVEVIDYDVVDFFQGVKPANAVLKEMFVYELPGEFPYSF